MNLNKSNYKRKVKKLIKKAENLNLIKSSDEAFKDFHVENEVHKGDVSIYRKISEKI